jgi:hypothetical protein
VACSWLLNKIATNAGILDKIQNNQTQPDGTGFVGRLSDGFWMTLAFSFLFSLFRSVIPYWQPPVRHELRLNPQMQQCISDVFGRLRQPRPTPYHDRIRTGSAGVFLITFIGHLSLSQQTSNITFCRSALILRRKTGFPPGFA